MFKNIFFSVLTLFILLLSNFLIASFVEVRFIEIMFFIGAGVSFIIFWFNSSGGTITNFSNSEASAVTGLKIEKQRLTYRISKPLLISIAYTLIGLAIFIMLVAGWI